MVVRDDTSTVEELGHLSAKIVKISAKAAKKLAKTNEEKPGWVLETGKSKHVFLLTAMLKVFFILVTVCFSEML